MNDKRRAELRRIRDRLVELQAEIGVLKDEEQNGFDNLPDSLQAAAQGQAMEAAAESLDEASDAIDEATQAIDAAIGKS